MEGSGLLEVFISGLKLLHIYFIVITTAHYGKNIGYIYQVIYIHSSLTVPISNVGFAPEDLWNV